MMQAAQPKLRAGRVYRTRDLSRWTSHPTGLARGPVDEGQFTALAHGLFVRPKRGRFGCRARLAGLVALLREDGGQRHGYCEHSLGEDDRIESRDGHDGRRARQRIEHRRRPLGQPG